MAGRSGCGLLADRGLKPHKFDGFAAGPLSPAAGGIFFCEVSRLLAIAPVPAGGANARRGDERARLQFQ
jgi:hypothetical protein